MVISLHRSAHAATRNRRANALLLTCGLALLMSSHTASAATLSATPSKTRPYLACRPATVSEPECDEIVEPAAYVRAKAASGEISPEEEGAGELGGWSPENLKSAYKLPSKGGSGKTVAIVDAYNYPDAEADLKVYREHYKLYYNSTETACTRANGCFKKVNQKGESSESETAAVYPAPETGWSTEMSLDLDMVSAVCPECKIVLVEANDNKENTELKVNNLYLADNEAASVKPAVISNSWGHEGEFATELELEPYLDHPGVQLLFAGGDHNYGPKYPATSPYVISVGGTQLAKSTNTRKWTEEVWHNEPEVGVGTGSGCSAYEEKPPWQTDTACKDRTTNDVSAVAYDLSAYDSYGYEGEERWHPRTGTSASTPIVAGIEAQASSATQLLGAQAYYKKPGMLFDITLGNDGVCTPPAEDGYLCTALTGYDGPTGEGTPDAVFVSSVPGGVTGLATGVESKGATVTGIVNPNGVATSYYFEYGTTTAYGKKTTETSAGSGTANVEVSSALTGLTAGTKYDYRLVVTYSGGPLYSVKQAFTTKALPPENTGLPVASPETPDQAVPETTTNGTWNNNPTSYEYQWERCNSTGGECTTIAGATKSSYTPVEGDVGHTLVAKVTAKNSAGSSSARSKATKPVKPIGQISEYELASGSEAYGIAKGPEGNLWVTDRRRNKIDKVTPAGTVTEYAVPAESQASEITAGPDGNMWFTDWNTAKIGKVTPSGTITEYSLPAGREPLGITAGADGNVWFAEENIGPERGGKIGKITTSGTITEYNLPNETRASGITKGPDGNLWFTEWTAKTGNNSRIGKITTAGTITEYNLPENSEPWSITTGPDGNLWFTEVYSNKIGKITTSGTVTQYAIGSENYYPYAITSGPDGNLWFTDWNYAHSRIERITTSGTVTEYSLPLYSDPMAITTGPEDNIWFTEEAKLGAITP